MNFGILEIITGIGVTMLGTVWRYYFNLRKEVEMLKLSLLQNYATNKSIEELAHNQKEMLDQMIQIKVDFATLVERERIHAKEGKKTV